MRAKEGGGLCVRVNEVMLNYILHEYAKMACNNGKANGAFRPNWRHIPYALGTEEVATLSGGGVSEEFKAGGAVARWNHLRRGLDDTHIFVRVTPNELLLQSLDGVALEGVLEGVEANGSHLGGQVFSCHIFKVDWKPCFKSYPLGKLGSMCLGKYIHKVFNSCSTNKIIGVKNRIFSVYKLRIE